MNIDRQPATWHTVADTALGELTLVRNEQGITGVYYPHHWHRPDVARFGLADDRGFDEVKSQLSQYLTGARHRFTVPLSAAGGVLDHHVWDRIAQIGYGRTTTYGELARDIGGGITAQQVGSIVGRNPVCILAPCHRVVGRGGKLIGYAGGIRRKQLLLNLEQDHADQTGQGLFSSITMA